MLPNLKHEWKNLIEIFPTSNTISFIKFNRILIGKFVWCIVHLNKKKKKRINDEAVVVVVAFYLHNGNACCPSPSWPNTTRSQVVLVMNEKKMCTKPHNISNNTEKTVNVMNTTRTTHIKSVFIPICNGLKPNLWRMAFYLWAYIELLLLLVTFPQ